MTGTTRFCRACGGQSSPQHPVQIRDVPTTMYRCGRCGMFFVADPTWLVDAYADPIAQIDVGLASRCVNMAYVLEAIARAERVADQPLLDYGGGYGLLTRLARDRGLDMRHNDPHTANLFAGGFEADLDATFGCISMVEVAEHLTDPVDVIRKLSAHTDLVLVSTVLVPPGTTDLTDWWYLGAVVGQHISFYTTQALAAIGEQAGYQLTSNGTSLHLLHRRPLRRTTRLVLRDARLSPLVALALRKRDRSSSLRDADGARITQQLVDRSARAAERRTRVGAHDGDH
jgi:hypothetical protein